MSGAAGVPQRAFRLPAGATEIVLVRHGASADAVPGVRHPLLDGQGNPALSPVGERQALAVADRLEHEPFATLFVTSLARTAQTAAPLAARRKLEPVVVPELREVFLGDWEGGEFRIRNARHDPESRRVYVEERWDVIPGAESMQAFGERLRAGVARIVAATGPDAVAAAVVHGGVIGELCRQATSSRPFAFIHADNGSLSRLVIHGDRWRLRSFNDVAHLGGVAAP